MVIAAGNDGSEHANQFLKLLRDGKFKQVLVEGDSSGSSSNTLQELDDCDITTPSADDVLKFDGSKWINVSSTASTKFKINSFTCSAGTNGTLIEVGVTGATWKNIGDISFSAVYANGPCESATILNNPTIGFSSANGYVGPATNTQQIQYPSPNTSKSFALSATKGNITDVNTIVLTFANRIYWGKSLLNYATSEGEVKSGNSELSVSRGKTFTINSGIDDYILFAYPARLGNATFTVGGFEGGFNLISSIPIQNEKGYTELYKVYCSTNKNLGRTTVVVN